MSGDIGAGCLSARMYLSCCKKQGIRTGGRIVTYTVAMGFFEGMLNAALAVEKEKLWVNSIIRGYSPDQAEVEFRLQLPKQDWSSIGMILEQIVGEEPSQSKYSKSQRTLAFRLLKIVKPKSIMLALEQ